MRRVLVPVLVFFLATLALPSGAAGEDSPPEPCDSTDTYALGGFQGIDDLGCNGTATCPASVENTPCGLELTVSISGTGLVEAAGFAKGTTTSCVGPLGCTFTIPFTLNANSTAAWACWGGVRSAAADVSLTCHVA